MRISKCDPDLALGRFRRGVGFQPRELRVREPVQEGDDVREVVVADGGVDDGSVVEHRVQVFGADLAVSSHETGFGDEVALIHGD